MPSKCGVAANAGIGEVCFTALLRHQDWSTKIKKNGPNVIHVIWGTLRHTLGPYGEYQSIQGSPLDFFLTPSTPSSQNPFLCSRVAPHLPEWFTLFCEGSCWIADPAPRQQLPPTNHFFYFRTPTYCKIQLTTTHCCQRLLTSNNHETTKTK